MRALLPLLVLLLPVVAAHGENAQPIAQGISFEMSPYRAYLDPDPEPLYAGDPNQAFRLQTYHEVSGYRQVDARLEVLAPDGTLANLSFQPVDARTMITRASLAQSGIYNLTLVIPHEGASLRKSATLEVYPDPGFRIEAVDPAAEVVYDVRTVLAFEVLDPITRERKDVVDDLTVRIDESSGDHRVVLASTEVALRREGPGLWKGEHVFPQGHFFLRFASRSAGLNYSDTPLLHVESEPLHAGAVTEKRESPAPSWSVVLALVAGAILVARRR